MSKSKPELKQTVWELYQSGLSAGAIAKRLGLSRSGVNWHLRGRKLRSKKAAWSELISRGYSFKKGPANPQWKAGKWHHPSGYVYIQGPRGPVLEHRVLMERKLGRKLSADEQVHHVNGVRNDNRLENLELIDRDEHTRLHWAHLSKEEQNAKVRAAHRAWWGIGKREERT